MLGNIPEINVNNYDHDDIRKLNEWAFCADEALETARQLLAAVTTANYDEISCNDVNGCNWFDLRDKLLTHDEKSA